MTLWYSQLKMKQGRWHFKWFKFPNSPVMEALEERKVSAKQETWGEPWSVYERGFMIWCLYKQRISLRNSFSSWAPDVPSPLAYCSCPAQKTVWGKNFLHQSYWSEDAGIRNVNISGSVTETGQLFWVKIVFNLSRLTYFQNDQCHFRP